MKDIASFQFHEDGFEYRGKTFSYADVESIEWFSIDCCGTIDDPIVNQADLLVYLSRIPTPLKLKAGSRFWDRFTPTEDIRALASLRKELSRRTYASRLARYLGEAAERGYFSYAHCDYYRDGRVLSSKDGRTLFNISTHVIEKTRDPLTLKVSKASNGVLGRIGSQLGHLQLRISTDTDVFLALLEEVYGLSFRPVKGDAPVKQAFNVVRNKVLGNSKRCPYCAERIRAEAIKCKHCQSPLT